MDFTELKWGKSPAGATCAGSATSHSRSPLPPTASVFPSGLNATAPIALSCGEISASRAGFAGLAWAGRRTREFRRAVGDIREGCSLVTALIPRPRLQLAPGAVHVPGWLTLDQQRRLVEACRGWASGPVPIRSARLPSGHLMSVQTVCLGWHWQPYRYSRTADDAGGARVAEFPGWMVDLGRRALAEAYRDPATGDGYTPDTALINFYDSRARLGMHQDKDERSSAPVVSLSIGDTCVFRFGNTVNRNKPYTDVELASGDLFVFGGPSRFAYHAVPAVMPGTGDPATGLTNGRLNITMRVTGLTDASA